MNARAEGIRGMGKRARLLEKPSVSQFGSRVLSLTILEQRLSQKAYQNFVRVREGKEKFDLAHADAFAEVMRDWAVKEGATHFTHWFQPLTDASAEKHDSFLNWSDKTINIFIKLI